MTTSHRLRLATVAVALGLIATACTSDTATNGAVGGSAPTTPASTTGGDLCATVPALDVITAQLGEPVTAVRRLERGPGTELCEAAGDGVASAQFTRVTPSSREAVVELAGSLGYSPTDLGDPALPGAITYAGAVSVFVDGVEYTVQAIAMDTVGDPSSPVAAQRSAALLALWLQNLGLGQSSITPAPSPTAPPTQAPVVTKPRPTTPAPTGPQLSNVALSGYPGGITCTPGDVLTITLTFTATNAAGVLIWSSTDGNIGQFPAEFGQADVPYTCSAMQTLFTLYPVAEGGALGTPVNLEV